VSDRRLPRLTRRSQASRELWPAGSHRRLPGSCRPGRGAVRPMGQTAAGSIDSRSQRHAVVGMQTDLRNQVGPAVGEHGEHAGAAAMASEAAVLRVGGRSAIRPRSRWLQGRWRRPPRPPTLRRVGREGGSTRLAGRRRRRRGRGARSHGIAHPDTAGRSRRRPGGRCRGRRHGGPQRRSGKEGPGAVNGVDDPGRTAVADSLSELLADHCVVRPLSGRHIPNRFLEVSANSRHRIEQTAGITLVIDDHPHSPKPLRGGMRDRVCGLFGHGQDLRPWPGSLGHRQRRDRLALPSCRGCGDKAKHVAARPG